jgi:hypothetical protein
MVTDGLTTADCVTGGGGSAAWCRWTGTAWRPVGGGGVTIDANGNVTGFGISGNGPASVTFKTGNGNNVTTVTPVTNASASTWLFPDVGGSNNYFAYSTASAPAAGIATFGGSNVGLGTTTSPSVTYIDGIASASPGTPAAGHNYLYADNTFQRWHSVNSSGVDNEIPSLNTTTLWAENAYSATSITTGGAALITTVANRNIRILDVLVWVTTANITGCTAVNISNSDQSLDVVSVVIAGLTTGARLGSTTTTNTTWTHFGDQLGAGKGLQIRATVSNCTGTGVVNVRVLYTYN